MTELFYPIEAYDEFRKGLYVKANYTLAVVHRDGVPQDVWQYGTDLSSALRELAKCQAHSNFHHECWMVYDADDPERGYFDQDDLGE